MDFATAKLQVNPDPNWFPVRGSTEHQEILTIMKQSGTISLNDRIPTALEKDKKHTWKNGRYINPVNAIVKEVKLPRISKTDFMKVPSNRTKVEDLLGIYGIPMQIPEREKKPITAKPSGLPKDTKKKLSKEEFMKLGQNKEYIEQHINYYKK